MGRLSRSSVVFTSGWIIKVFPAPAGSKCQKPLFFRARRNNWLVRIRKDCLVQAFFAAFPGLNTNGQPAQSGRMLHLGPDSVQMSSGSVEHSFCWEQSHHCSLLVGRAETQHPCPKQQQLSPQCCHGVKWDWNFFSSQLVLELWCSDVQLLWCSFLGWKVWFFLLLLWTDFSCSCPQSKWDSTNPAMRATSAERFYKLQWTWIKNCNSYLSREVEKGRHLIATRINFLCLHSWLFFLSLDDYRYCILGLIGNFPTPYWSKLRCATFPPSHNHHWTFPRRFGWLIISSSSCLKCNKILISWTVLKCALEPFIPQLKLWLHLGWAL